jgi:hypothetical protein
MPTVRYGASVDGGGVSINQNISRTADTCIGYEVTLPVGFAGTLSTRTDANTGTVTLAGGHGISTADVVDIHWSGGVQYNVTVGTVSVNSMPFDVGIGDDLPDAATAVVVTKQVTVSTAIDGDNCSLIAICLESSEGTSGKGHINFLDSGPASIEEIDLVGNVPRVFDITGGDTNVFTGNPVVSSKATNGSSTAAATLKIVVLADSTP